MIRIIYCVIIEHIIMITESYELDTVMHESL